MATRGIKVFRQFDRVIRRVPKVRGLWQRALVNNLRRYLYRVRSEDWPPIIGNLEGIRWNFRR